MKLETDPRGAAGRMAIGGVVALVALAALAQNPAAPDYKKVRYAEVTAIIPKLTELAAWCQTATLFRERDRLNAIVITLDPDHAACRAALQYRKQTDGTWVRSTNWRESKNTSEKSMPEYLKRRAEVVDPVALRLLEALDREKTSMDPGTRDTWLGEILELAPDNAKVREAFGETRVGDRWVLAETASAYERRPEYLAYAVLDRDSPKTLEDAKPDDFESKLALKWSAARQSTHLRLVATVPAAQVDKALKHFEGTWLLTHRVFGIEPDPVQMTVVLLNGAGEAKVFLLTHPETPDFDRGKELLGYTLCTWKTAVIAEETETERLGAGRFRLSALSLAWGLGTTDRPAWTIEGFGGYVSWLLTLKFEPFFWSRYPGGAAFEHLPKALAKPNANWLEVAAGLVKQGKAPALKTLMTTDLDKGTLVDALFSTALMAFLLEGKPADAGRVVKAACRGLEPDVAIRETLGIDLAAFEKRFHRWIQEASLPPPKK